MDFTQTSWEKRESELDGQGSFAVRSIRAGESILPYRGPRIPMAEVEESDGPVYWMAWDDDWAIDGSGEDNPARFFNHSCDPNCEAIRLDGAIWIRSIRKVEEGEELTFDYGWGLDGLFQHGCRCGAPSCVGYIVGEPYRPLARKILRQMQRGRL